jgi:predicted acyltransferase
MCRSEGGNATNDSPATRRLASLDQFRGYTVAGMLLVNFLGSYVACPRILKHTNDYVSYADTIMPQFLFAVGFAMRLSIGRRLATEGGVGVYLRMVRRLLGLVLVALVVYTVGKRAESWDGLVAIGVWGSIAEPLKRDWFQTLTHIAVTSLWLLPIIHRGATARILWMIGSGIAHVGLSYGFNFAWVNAPPAGIDGGPLGFLTWTIPAVVGTLACDVFVRPRYELRLHSPVIRRVAFAAVLLMGLGYTFSCGTRFYDVYPTSAVAVDGSKLADDPVIPPADLVRARLSTADVSSLLAEPPFVPPPGIDQRRWNYWMMSQRGGTLSYLTFSAGFSLLVYLGFFIACDLWGWRLSFFQTFGTNALLAYVLHDMVSDAVRPFIPKDAPAWYVLGGLIVFFLITWSIVRHFEKQSIYLRV